MKRFVIALILLSALASGKTEDEPRSQFLDLYYRGRYEESHRLLNTAFTDGVHRAVWDQRIHLKEDAAVCEIGKAAGETSRAVALLRIGRFEEAKSSFGKDWISLEGLAWLSRWSNDNTAARSLIQEAMVLQPDRPDLLFFAGKVAGSNEDTVKYFSRFLELEKEDEPRRLSAENAIAFIRKTAGMEIHRLTPPDGIDTIPLDLRDSGSTFPATVDGKKVRLMLDTGASGLILKNQNWSPQIESEVLLRGLGKSERSPTSVLVLKDFRAGSFQVTNPTATVAETMPTPDYDGLAGTALFSTHRLLLPHKKGKDLVLLPYNEDAAAYLARMDKKLEKKAEVPFYLVERMIIAKGRIGKSPEDQDIVIDTGSRTSLISIQTAQQYARINYPLSREMQNRQGVSGVSGVTRDIFAAENVAVDLAGLRYNFNQMTALTLMGNSEGVGLEIDLILGRDFLKDYTLLIDYKNRTLTLYQ